MKGNSGSVWRTVLLAAFMCLAAGEAYGYEVWKSGKILVKEDCVLLVENGKEICSVDYVCFIFSKVSSILTLKF